jgi:hypothetical protein
VRTTNLGCGICLGLLALLSATAGADPDMASALASCRDEALSTGLQEEPDIQAYITLCMQAWQTPDSYVPADASLEASPEAAAAEAQPLDAAEDTPQPQ